MDRSAKIALANLVTHARSVRACASSLREFASKELERMEGLIQGHERDLKILNLVQIHPQIVPPVLDGRGQRTSTRERTLSSYVSPVKMVSVFDSCNKLYLEVSDQLGKLFQDEATLAEDTEAMTAEIEATSTAPSSESLEEATQALVRADELEQYIHQTCSPDENGWPAAEKVAHDAEALSRIDSAINELFLLDEVARQSVRRLAADKNDMVDRCLHALGDISALQSDFNEVSASLLALDGELKSNRMDGFRHLARLKNMLWAYGSSLIEIVRRREFTKAYLSRSQGMAELMASLTSIERRRRSDFKREVVGQLPWDVKGLDDATPSLELSTAATGESAVVIEREDLEAFFKMVDDIDRQISGSDFREGQGPLQETKKALRALVARLDNFDSEFMRLVEMNLLKQDDSDEESVNEDEDEDEEARLLRRIRSAPSNGFGSARGWKAEREKMQQEIEELQRQLADTRRSVAQAHDEEVTSLRTEASRLRAEVRSQESAIDTERSAHEEAKRLLETLRADAETEEARRINMQEELQRLRDEVEEANRSEKEAKVEASEEAERSNELETQVHEMQAELEEIRAAKEDASNRIESLLSEGSSAERELSSAHHRIDDLTEQLRSSRAETREIRDQLQEAETAKDKALRNFRAEADGDRAILEENLKGKEREIDATREKSIKAQAEASQQRQEVASLRGQLEAADEAHDALVQQLETAKDEASDAEMAKRHIERQLDGILNHTRPMVAKTIELSRFVRALPALSTRSSKERTATSENVPVADASPGPTVPLQGNTAQVADEPHRREAFDAFEADPRFATAEVVLEALKAAEMPYAQDEARNKLDSVTKYVKKWMKAYRTLNEKYRVAQELSRKRIAYQNFTVGDLCLFLPTRNDTSASKPWAAFNVGSPHHFLNKESAMIEQRKNRDWVLSRITSISEKVTNSAEGESGNPFNLPDGMRYFVLDADHENISFVGTPGPTRRKTSASIGEMGFKTQPQLRRSESLPRASEPGQASDSAVLALESRRQTSEGLPPIAGSSEVPTPPSLTPEDGSPAFAENGGEDKGDFGEERQSRRALSNVLSTSTPATMSKPPEVLSQRQSLSRASSPPAISGIARAFKGTHWSFDQPSNNGFSGGPARWPLASERERGSSSLNGSGGALRSPGGILDLANPAFGTKRKAVGSEVGIAATLAAKPAGAPRNGEERLPSNAVAIANPASAAIEMQAPPNPFSQSPAPAALMGGSSPIDDYFAQKSKRNTEEPSTPSAQGKGKGTEKDPGQTTAVTRSSPNRNENLASGRQQRQRRRPSTTSIASSNASSVGAFAARSAAPKTTRAISGMTMQTAQGSNYSTPSLGANETGNKEASSSGLSGDFSTAGGVHSTSVASAAQVSSRKSAGTEDRRTVGSGFPSSGSASPATPSRDTRNGPRRSSSAVHPVQTLPLARARKVSTASTASGAAGSPVNVKSPLRLFGSFGDWGASLGRRSASSSTLGPSSRSPLPPPQQRQQQDDEQRDSDGEEGGEEEAEEEDRARRGLLSASQSLRRLHESTFAPP